VTDRVQPLVEDVAAELGVEVYDLEFSGGTLRVVLHRAGGVDLDVLADANRRLSRRLDDADPIPGRYTLEVSSRGLERALRTEAHWADAVGERVKVKLMPGVDGDRRFDGVVTGVVDGVVSLAEAERAVTFRIEDVSRGRTHFEWGPAPKPGGPRRDQRAAGPQPSPQTEVKR